MKNHQYIKMSKIQPLIVARYNTMSTIPDSGVLLLDDTHYWYKLDVSTVKIVQSVKKPEDLDYDLSDFKDDGDKFDTIEAMENTIEGCTYDLRKLDEELAKKAIAFCDELAHNVGGYDSNGKFHLPNPKHYSTITKRGQYETDTSLIRAIEEIEVSKTIDG